MLVFALTSAACGAYTQASTPILSVAATGSIIGLASSVAYFIAKRAHGEIVVEADRRASGPVTELSSHIQQLTEQNTQLQRSNQVLEQLSITDGLTKLNNHRSFQDHLTREIKRVNRYSEPLSLLMIDIDDFKYINDHLGHPQGDKTLQGLAEVLSGRTRRSDICARFGGDEFIILLPHKNKAQTFTLAQRICQSVASADLLSGDRLVTVSVGAANFPDDARDKKTLLQAADDLLYRAKKAGKNQACGNVTAAAKMARGQ